MGALNGELFLGVVHDNGDYSGGDGHDGDGPEDDPQGQERGPAVLIPVLRLALILAIAGCPSRAGSAGGSVGVPALGADGVEGCDIGPGDGISFHLRIGVGVDDLTGEDHGYGRVLAVLEVFEIAYLRGVGAPLVFDAHRPTLYVIDIGTVQAQGAGVAVRLDLE